MDVGGWSRGATCMRGITCVSVATSGTTDRGRAILRGRAEERGRRRHRQVDRLDVLAAQHGCGAQDSLHGLQVAGAPAQHAGQGFAHFGFGGVWLTFQQRARRQDHAGGTEAALDRTGLDEGLLQRIQSTRAPPALLRVLADRFDRRQRVPTGLDGQQHARAHRLAVQQDRACAALAALAAVLGAKQPERLAQHVQQGDVGRNVEFNRMTVEYEGGKHQAPTSPARRRTRTAATSDRYSADAQASSACA